MFDWFDKRLPKNIFNVMLVKILHLETQHVMSTSVWIYSSKRKCDWLKGGWVSRKGDCKKRSRWNNEVLIDGVLINGNRANMLQFYLRISIEPTTIEVLWIHPSLRRPRFLLTFLFKFTYKCFIKLVFHR